MTETAPEVKKPDLKTLSLINSHIEKGDQGSMQMPTPSYRVQTLWQSGYVGIQAITSDVFLVWVTDKGYEALSQGLEGTSKSF